ncbi:hypothetical protein FZC33_11215 [Labrys sp. KNU-23]|uniref:hypothetical protein n=1 Tax=Labrys sp. KNU-23 TaxID=2789216 RepID=UPI001255BF9A|nr:hypothetical protein [Labrys sp. KNU-23]QEN86860.1 hypothetical protein FZC33_11215 [Labrys sp. KNU-23]
MAPVPVPAVQEGQDARLLAAQALGSTAAANDRLTRSRRWYEQLRHCYAAPADPACEKEARP